MRCVLMGVVIGVLALLPSNSLGNSGRPPGGNRGGTAGLWPYLNQPDPKFKEDGKAAKSVRIDYSAPMKIAFRHEARAKLIVPRKYVIVQAKAENEPINQEDKDATAQLDSTAIGQPSPRHLMMAGIAFSASFVGGGLWFMRSSWSRGAKMAVLFFLLTGGLLASPFLAEIIGNGARPSNRDRQKEQIPEKKIPTQQSRFDTDDKALHQDVDIEIVEEGNSLILVLPKTMTPAQLLPDNPFPRRFQADE